LQKNKLLAVTILSVLLLSSALAVSTAQQAPSKVEQDENAQDNTAIGMAIGIGSAIFTVSLIGVLFFRKQN
jgi:uncharacterized membrane protein YidH (DUF202 family)